MSDKSHIEWTDATWNPTTGCTKVSEGCRHCYIDRTPPFRIKGISFDKGEEIGATTGVQLHPDRLDQPLRWKRPRRVFVNSLSDLFHDAIPEDFIVEVFAVMALADRHTFQVLTKRPRRMMEILKARMDVPLAKTIEARVGQRAMAIARERGENVDDVWWDAFWTWPLPNVWLGTSVEDQKAAELRIPLLLETPAAVRFLSCEPLLGALEVAHFLGEKIAWIRVLKDGVPWDIIPGSHGIVPGIEWVIAGGESGPKARPMHPDWARSLRDQCTAARVPFFFKQWGEWVTEDQSPQDITLPSSGSVPWAKWDSRTEDLVGDQTTVYKVGKKHAGRELDGRTWDEMPARERVG